MSGHCGDLVKCVEGGGLAEELSESVVLLEHFDELARRRASPGVELGEKPGEVGGGDVFRHGGTGLC